MPSGYPFGRFVRRELFDLVCQGMTVSHGRACVGCVRAGRDGCGGVTLVR